jgi:hypothetical protein
MACLSVLINTSSIKVFRLQTVILGQNHYYYHTTSHSELVLPVRVGPAFFLFGSWMIKQGPSSMKNADKVLFLLHREESSGRA